MQVTHRPELPFEDVTTHSRIRGCLLGGAVADAVGAPVEFLSLKEICDRFGNLFASHKIKVLPPGD
jgi:ADP-ribosylglycohydrolase